ncbi:MAG TPA: ankyrin repeat domain-containing protein [Chthoniobacterales bacterium]
MSTLHLTRFLASMVVVPLLLAGGGLGPEPPVASPISADEFVQAMVSDRSPLLDLYFDQRLNPNARGPQDRPLLLAATLQADEPTVNRLLEAGASPDLADENGLTPLMAAAMQGNMNLVRKFVGGVTNINTTDRAGRSALQCAVTAQKTEVIQLLLRLTPDFGPQGGGDVAVAALETGNKEIISMIFDRIPQLQQWTARTRRAIDAAISSGNAEQTKLLLSKHAVPPTPQDRSVPLLAYAIASNNEAQFKALLAGGADPNTLLPAKCDKDFLDSIKSQSLRAYIEEDKNVTVLMVAAGVGQPDYVRGLLQAGADRNRATGRYKMLALYLAAQQGSWQCTQILLGGGPSPDQLHIEISLANQRAELWKDGVPVMTSVCSTGRQGYSTRPGDYVITDKEKSHRSTIYKVEMPYFMRLSCLDFGMHEGVVPNYPASHGCIRLPGDFARKLFAEIPVGTLVTVK